MAIDFSKEVEYVARLARLELEPEEKEMMAGQLSEIIDTARRVQELNTGDVEPTSHVTNLPALLREDVVKDSLSQEEAMRNAPRRQGDYFRVPGIGAADKKES